MYNHKIFFILMITALLVVNTNINNLEAETIAACQSDFPIVLSHHWGAEKCDGGCDYTPAELDLPPRNYNKYDASLSREMNEYYRYYSKEIVDRLQTECGNDVYLSDKPTYATYEIRAKSLRNTVKEALMETGKDKVIIIGMSQGCQDARYMVNNLPVDDNNPAGVKMRDKVAAIVTIVGEDKGAGSASLYLGVVYVECNGVWDDPSCNSSWSDDPEDPNDAAAIHNIVDSVWKDKNENFILIENSTVALDQLLLYKTVLASFVNLSRKYMMGPERDNCWDWDWQDLVNSVSYDSPCDKDNDLWCVDNHWYIEQAITEKNNGVEYFSYAAKIRNWSNEFNDSAGYLSYLGMKILWGDENDAYVSVDSQSFLSKEKWWTPEYMPNFHHVKTLKGRWLGRGYHHMFFAGRNDSTLASGPNYRESAPYNGGSADFYEQVVRNLVSQGF